MGKIMHGNAIGLSGVLTLNPRNNPYKSGIETAPMPLLDNKTIMLTQKSMNPDIFTRSANLLQLDGIQLINLKIEKKILWKLKL